MNRVCRTYVCLIVSAFLFFGLPVSGFAADSISGTVVEIGASYDYVVIESDGKNKKVAADPEYVQEMYLEVGDMIKITLDESGKKAETMDYAFDGYDSEYDENSYQNEEYMDQTAQDEDIDYTYSSPDNTE